MGEVDLNVQNGEEIKKKSKRKSAIIGTIVCVIGFSLLIYMIVAVVLADNKQSKRELEVTATSMEVTYSEYLGYSATITGTAKNNTSKNYSYASVEFAVYDSAGNNLGTALANINNLMSGDTWKFSAALLGFPETRPTTYKLVDITVW